MQLKSFVDPGQNGYIDQYGNMFGLVGSLPVLYKIKPTEIAPEPGHKTKRMLMTYATGVLPVLISCKLNDVVGSTSCGQYVYARKIVIISPAKILKMLGMEESELPYFNIYNKIFNRLTKTGVHV